LSDSNFQLRIYRTSGSVAMWLDYIYIKVYYTPCSFAYRKSVTVQSSQVVSGPHTNFPILVSISGDADIKDTSHSGHVTSTSGYDIIFRALDSTTCGGASNCTLSHEIESYDGTNGNLVAWVKVPSIDNGTVIYMYYGNGCITSSTQNAADVWSNSYEAVYHLNNNANDSLGNHNGSISGATSTTSGKFAGAYDFDGNNDYISVSPNANWGCGGFTIEVWWNVDDKARTETMVGLAESSGATINIYHNSTYMYNYIYTEGTYAGNDEDNWASMSSVSNGNWYYQVLRRPPHGSCKSCIQGFFNGDDMGSGCETLWGETNMGDSFNIGALYGASRTQYFQGLIDEVRFSNTARSAEWIHTTYHNSNAPTTFYNLGSEESSPPSAVTLSSFKATAYEDGNVLLQWKTGYEVNNLGFHVYREEGGRLYELISEPIKGSALMTGPGNITAGYSYSWWDISAIADVQGSLTLEDRPSASRTVPPTAGLEANNPSAASEAHEPNMVQGEALLKRSAPQAKRSGSLAVGGQRSTVSDQPSAVSSQRSTLRYWLEDIDLNGTKTMHGPVTPVISHKPAPKKAQSMLLSQINKQGVGGRVSGVGAEARSQHPAVSGQRSAPPPLPSPLEGEGGGGGASSAALPKPGVPRANIAVSSMDDRNEVQAGRKIFTPLSDKPLKRSSEVQQVLAGSQAIKIYIQEEGWYRVTQPELVAAGLDPGVNPRFLQLFVDGEEQPIIVKGGKDDRLGSRGFIEFYGTGLDTPYTDTRVYWLVPGSKPGKRIDSHIFNPLFRNPQSAIRNSFESFPYTVEKKDRTIYAAALKNGDASNFFGPVVSATPLDQVLKVSHLDPSAPGDALLEVSLQGVTVGAHQVRVMINGVVVGTMVFEGQALKAERFPLVQAGLVEGENVVTLVGQGVPLDVSLVDSIRLTYWRTYTAEEDILKFTSVGGNHLSVNGFSSSSIRVVDITDLQNLKEVGGTVKGEGGGYSFRFQVPGNGKRTLLAFVDEEARTPAALELNQPSRWHQGNQSADMVMISHGYFLESLKPLKTLRESQGLSVALIDVEDLYDEFSFGIKPPQALKDFLSHAKLSWQKAPRFVLLVGDASFDPRNYYGFGHFDYVPTKLVDTNYIETASDDWFVDFNGDGLPEMAIGRLPVRTAEESASVVSKLIGYEQSREPMKDVLLVADMRDKDFDYMAASLGVKALLPGNLNVSEVYRDQFPDDVQVKNELLRRLNQGPLLVNYIGHGTLEFWRGDIFGSDDAEALTNGLRLPLVIGMTCLTGFFQDVYYETLAESFLKAKNGGAVAVWTSSGLTEPDKQAVMNKEMIRLLFNGEGLTLGEAAVRAKASVTDMDIRKTWILFGDPTTRLKSR
jgi:hypothetical protein